MGDLLAVFFDKDGSPVPLSRDACRIGIGMDALEQIPVVVAVAAGRAKHEAILAALKTKCIDVLVTDTATVDYLRDAIGPQVLAGS